MLHSRINFIIGTSTDETILRRKIEVYCARYSELKITFSNLAIPLETASLYITHVSRVKDVPKAGSQSSVPVICHGPPQSLTNAWHSGASDYLKEPWNASELHFRVRRILSGTNTRFLWHGIAVDIDSFSFNKNSVPISYQEFRILRLLAENEGTPVPRESLYYTIWGRPGPKSRVVDMHVSKLRKKLQFLLNGSAISEGPLISSVRGEGYALSWTPDRTII